MPIDVTVFLVSVIANGVLIIRIWKLRQEVQLWKDNAWKAMVLTKRWQASTLEWARKYERKFGQGVTYDGSRS